VGHIGHEFLPLVFALLQKGCHVVEGQGQLLHFLGVVPGQAHPGVQVPVAEGVGSLAQVPKGTALLPGKETYGHNGDEHHRQGGREEDVGDMLHDGSGGSNGGGDNDDAGNQPVIRAENGLGNHIPGFLIESINDAGEHVAAALDDLFQILRIVDEHTLMLAAE